jgi:hypothetical protein
LVKQGLCNAGINRLRTGDIFGREHFGADRMRQ